VGKALKAPLSSLGILSDYAARKIRGYVTPGRLTRTAPELAGEAEIVSRYAGAASNILGRVLRKHGGAVIEREYHQERLANIVIDLYASLAVLSRATAAVASRGSEKAADEVGLARAFIQAAKYRIVGQLKDMDRNTDDSGDSRDALHNRISETAYSRPGYGFNYWE
jgi:hypothetical protein